MLIVLHIHIEILDPLYPLILSSDWSEQGNTFSYEILMRKKHKIIMLTVHFINYTLYNRKGIFINHILNLLTSSDKSAGISHKEI